MFSAINAIGGVVIKRKGDQTYIVRWRYSRTTHAKFARMLAHWGANPSLNFTWRDVGAFLRVYLRGAGRKYQPTDADRL